MNQHRFPRLTHFIFRWVSLLPNCTKCGFDYLMNERPDPIDISKREYSEEEISYLDKEELVRLLKAGYRMWLVGDSMAAGDYWVLRKD